MAPQLVRYPSPSGRDVAAFLGRPGDERLIALGDVHIVQISALARAYTRGMGFRITNVHLGNNVFSAEPNDEIAAVIIMATARLVVNPAQVASEEADGYRTQGAFGGWTLAERMLLDRYRLKAG